MILWLLSMSLFVSKDLQLVEDAAWVEVVYFLELKHAETQKSLSWSMVDGMSEKQQKLQVEDRVAQIRAGLAKLSETIRNLLLK